MLNLYQRRDEPVRPWPIISADLWRDPDVLPDGQYLIAIQDEDEAVSFLTLKNCLPVFISLRAGADGQRDEIALGIPDGDPDVAAVQTAAAMIENGIAAVECMKPAAMAKIMAAYGLRPADRPDAGPRAARQGAAPAGRIRVSIFYKDVREDYTLSRKCPALTYVSSEETIVLAGAPLLYAASLFNAAADVWKDEPQERARKVCEDFGIDLQTFSKEK